MELITITAVMFLLMILGVCIILISKKFLTQSCDTVVTLESGGYFKCPTKLWFFYILGAVIFSAGMALPAVVLAFSSNAPVVIKILRILLSFWFLWFVLFIYFCHRNTYMFIDKKKIELYYGFKDGKRKKINFEINEIESINFKPQLKRLRKILIITKDGKRESIAFSSLKMFRGYKQIVTILMELSETINR